MFRDANSHARKFTLPIIISQRLVNGKCSSSIGAITVINDEGWFLTAGHILMQIKELSDAATKYQAKIAEEAAIRADQSIDTRERKKKLAALGKKKDLDVKEFSVYIGLQTKTQISDIAIHEAVDLGVGRLEPFDSKSITEYPVFKNPNLNFDCGTSLCKLGFPFHSFTPTFNEQSGEFELPAAFPIPFFPIDGIFTRTSQLVLQNGQQSDIDMKLVETSSPGIPGQSGGPTFDTKGRLWAIQSKTFHYPLSFSNSIPPQWFHVGLGVHPTTIFQVLNLLAVKYNISED